MVGPEISTMGPPRLIATLPSNERPRRSRSHTHSPHRPAHHILSVSALNPPQKVTASEVTDFRGTCPNALARDRILCVSGRHAPHKVTDCASRVA